METKYETLKRAYRKAQKNWDNYPSSNSAKAAYLEAKQDLVDYYNEICYPELELFAVAA